VLFRVVVVALVSIAAVPAAALAATVSPIGGEVRVSSGNGFRLIAAPTELSAGSQVMVSANGAASIAYSENCVMRAVPAAITVVQRLPQCGNFPAPSYFGFARSNEEGLGAAEDLFGFTPKVGTPPVFRRRTQTTARPPPSEEPPPAREPPPADPAPEAHDFWDHSNLLVIGGVVAGAGLLAVLLASQGSDGPASP